MQLHNTINEKVARDLPAVLLATVLQGKSAVKSGNPTGMEGKESILHRPVDSQHVHCICLK